MNHNSRFIKLILLMISIFSLLIGLERFSTNITSAIAQTSGLDWAGPENISKSGSTTNPVMVIDSSNTIHAIWEDEFAGIMYSRKDSDSWQEPAIGEFPFEDVIPQLIASNDNNIHAFWLDGESDLLHSQISAEQFGVTNEWSFPTAISESIIEFTTIVDEIGNIHLAYFISEGSSNSPVGLYYTSRTPNSTEWNQPQLIFESAYFRSISPEIANIQLETKLNTDESSSIFIVWDIPVLRRVYFIKSDDGGQNWDEFFEIDGPKANSSLSSPFDISISSLQDMVLLTWEVGQRDGVCNQYYRLSDDAGESWSEPQIMQSGLQTTGCPSEFRLIGNTSDSMILYTNVFGQIYLQAWNGIRWSEPQPQNELSTFINPTNLTNINLGCLNFEVSGNNIIYLLGCDLEIGRDIWFSSAQIDNVDNWFTTTSVWSNPIVITSSEEKILSPKILADTQSNFHTFWIQNGRIWYSKWENDRWTPALNIINPPGNMADTISAVIAPNGLVHIVWSEGESGMIYYSWANLEQTTVITEWADRTPLPIPRSATQRPEIHVNDSTLSVIYTIPINEGRGVYLIQSTDAGATWSEPITVFNAEGTDWGMVQDAQVVSTINGKIHTLWKTFSFNGAPVGLYTSSSMDNVYNWSNPELVKNAPVIWSDLIRSEDTVIHRIWQEDYPELSEIWHAYSSDNGSTWQRPSYISSLGNNPASLDLSVDGSGILNLTLITHEVDGNFTLQHWNWNDLVWKYVDGFEITKGELAITGKIASAISPSGRIMVVYPIYGLEDSLDNNNFLYYSGKFLDISTSNGSSDIESTPQEVPQEVLPEQSVTPEVEPTELAGTPTQNFIIPGEINTSGSPTNASWVTSIVIGLSIAIGVLVIITLVIILRTMNRI